MVETVGPLKVCVKVWAIILVEKGFVLAAVNVVQHYSSQNASEMYDGRVF